MSLEEEVDAVRYVKRLKEFWSHFFMYLIFVIALGIYAVPDRPGILWLLLGWGVGVAVHGVFAYRGFSFFGPDWERKMIEKRLNRKS
ncbi:2TM domain-containing protein [Xanthomonas melonis]|uniref:2TM domain-containing protein n=1 Tax=Xanthomonas melonis TaxID=56456 RepID=UPI003EB928F2